MGGPLGELERAEGDREERPRGSVTGKIGGDRKRREGPRTAGGGSKGRRVRGLRGQRKRLRGGRGGEQKGQGGELCGGRR